MDYKQFLTQLSTLGEERGKSLGEEIRTSASTYAEALFEQTTQAYQNGVRPTFNMELKDTSWKDWTVSDQNWLREKYGCQIVVKDEKWYIEYLDKKEVEESYYTTYYPARENALK